MARNLLSENQIKKLFKDHDPEKVERHNDGDGLIFEMRKKGQPRWVFRYTKPSGGVTEKSLGPWPTLSIAEAREQADELRAKLLKGDDPAAPPPTAEKKTLSLEDMAGEFLESQTWSAKHRETVIARLKYIPQSVRAMPLDQISPRLLMEQVLRPLEHAEKLETAKRVRIIISQIYRYAIALGDVFTDPARDLQSALKPAVKKPMAAIVTEDAFNSVM